MSEGKHKNRPARRQARSSSSATDLNPAVAYSAGHCVLLDDQGQVIAARVAQASGDPSLNDRAVSLARQLQWNAAGWLGARIILSQAAPAAAPNGSTPRCSAASERRPRRPPTL